ncbi:MAG: RDD family protein [Pseudomonadota bacterium]
MNSEVKIKTATGVDLNLKVAGPGARSYAYCIDWHIRVLFALTLFFGLSFLGSGSIQVPTSTAEGLELFWYLVFALPLAVYFLYHPVFEFLSKGRTPGKRIAGVRIVTQEAQVPGALAILIRNVLRIIDSLPFGYLVGLLTTYFTRDSVRLGDVAAGTLLVYERDEYGKRKSGELISPEALDRYGVELTEIAQDLLDRWKQLEESQRQEMGVKLLARLTPDAGAPGDSDALRDRIRDALTGARAKRDP